MFFMIIVALLFVGWATNAYLTDGYDPSSTLTMLFHNLDQFGQQHWGFILVTMAVYYVLRNIVNSVRANLAVARSTRFNSWDSKFMEGTPYINPGQMRRQNPDNLSPFERAQRGDWSQMPNQYRPASNMND